MLHSFGRNEDNLSQTGHSQTCRQTCSWCPATSHERGLHALWFFSSTTPVTCAMQFEWLTSISWPNSSWQNKSPNSTWCQSLLSLNGMVVRVNENFEKRGVVWIESWLWMISEEDVCWVVGIPPTCNVLAWSKSKGLFHLVYVVIKKKY